MVKFPGTILATTASFSPLKLIAISWSGIIVTLPSKRGSNSKSFKLKLANFKLPLTFKLSFPKGFDKRFLPLILP